MARSSGKSDQEPECLRVLGILKVRAGDYAEAESLFGQALAASQAGNDAYRQGLALMELGRLFEQRGDMHKASEMSSAAREIFERLGAAHDLQQARALCDRCERKLDSADSQAADWLVDIMPACPVAKEASMVEV